MKKTLAAFAAAGMLMLPVMTFAQGAANQPPSIELDEQFGADAGIATDDLPSFVSTMIRWILGIIGVLLVALFVYGGVLYATSAGNEDRVETGKRVMIYAIIGTVIVFAAFVVSDFVISALLSTSGA